MIAKKQITEFHNIMAIRNIPSIVQRGILSHEKASNVPHNDISMERVQERRSKKAVTNGLMLHQYANLYFCARNPMMYSRLHLRTTLCVLQVSTDILNVDGVVLADQNAASDFVRFYSPKDIDRLDIDKIFAPDWNHADPFEKERHKRIKCAEVLVPSYVPASYILGAYVFNSVVQQELFNMEFPYPITVKPFMFFEGEDS